jgi:hypothetical protein
MKPHEPSTDDVNYWCAREETYAQTLLISGPGELADDVRPCPAIIMPEKNMVTVRWELSEIELAQLANGGRLWLTTWGGLPIHTIEVIPKDANPHDPG